MVSPLWPTFPRSFHLSARCRPGESPSEQNTTKTNSQQTASLTLTRFSRGDTVRSLVVHIQLISDGLRSRPAVVLSTLLLFPLLSLAFSKCVSFFSLCHSKSISPLLTDTPRLASIQSAVHSVIVDLPLHPAARRCHHRRRVQPKATTAS